jgi:hypothetical protein
MAQKGLMMMTTMMVVVELLFLINQWTQKLSDWQFLKDSAPWS